MSGSPLAGLRVLVTRERAASEAFASLLESAGARPVICPAIEIVFRNPPGLDEALRDLHRFDWLVLTSANSVHALALRFKELGLDAAGKLAEVNVAVVGQATEAALAELGARAEVVAEPANAMNLAERLEAVGMSGSLVLLPASRIARPELPQRLRSAGAGVVQLAVYETIAPREIEVPDRDLIDVVTFTSPSTVRNFIAVAGSTWLVTVPVVCIGPTTAGAARQAGIPSPVVAGEASLEGMVAALAQLNLEREQV